MVALVTDAGEPLTKQDLALAQRAVDEGRALIVVLNKVDGVPDVKKLELAVADRLTRAVWEAQGVQCVSTSALNGEGVQAVMPAVLAVYNNWSARVETRVLNRCAVVVGVWCVLCPCAHGIASQLPATATLTYRAHVVD